MDEPQPWERRMGESSRAFAAFAIYRDLAPRSRSCFAVANQLGYKISEARRAARRSPGRIYDWSRKFEWVKRACAWDAEQDRKLRAANETALLDMAERHARSSLAFQQRALERLRSLEVDKLSPSEVVRWFEVGVKVERLSRGTVIEMVRQENAGNTDIDAEITLAQRIVVDRRMRELEMELLRLATTGATDAGGSGGVGVTRQLDAGEPPDGVEHAADGPGGRPDDALAGDDAAAARQE